MVSNATGNKLSQINYFTLDEKKSLHISCWQIRQIALIWSKNILLKINSNHIPPKPPSHIFCITRNLGQNSIFIISAESFCSRFTSTFFFILYCVNSLTMRIHFFFKLKVWSEIYLIGLIRTIDYPLTIRYRLCVLHVSRRG